MAGALAGHRVVQLDRVVRRERRGDAEVLLGGAGRARTWGAGRRLRRCEGGARGDTGRRVLLKDVTVFLV